MLKLDWKVGLCVCQEHSENVECISALLPDGVLSMQVEVPGWVPCYGFEEVWAHIFYSRWIAMCEFYHAQLQGFINRAQTEDRIERFAHKPPLYTRCHNMIWYDIWYDMIWYDITYDIWYDMMWYDMTYGMI